MPRTERTGRFYAQSATAQAAEEEAERQRRHKRNVILGVVGGIIAIALAIAAAVALIGSGTAMRTVPNITNIPVDEAIEQIEASGFVAGEPEYTYNDTVKKGIVCEQDPAAYREMPEGSTINFKVSNGPTPIEQVVVPDLRNKTQEEAEQALKDANPRGQPRHGRGERRGRRGQGLLAGHRARRQGRRRNHHHLPHLQRRGPEGHPPTSSATPSRARPSAWRTRGLSSA